MTSPKLPWYQDGLPFKCTGCGQCCTGFPGYVWVTIEEIGKMAALLAISSEEFIKLYVRRVGGRLSLKELPKTYACVFLKGKLCAVYQERPSQCRTFPWWPDNLQSQEAWNEVASRCEGIGHKEASIISLSTIEEELKKC